MFIEILHGISGLLMGFFIPGFLVISIFFPKYDAIKKIALSIGVSICIDIVLTLILGENKLIYTRTGGVNEYNVWFFLSMICLFSLLYLTIKRFDFKAVQKALLLDFLSMGKNKKQILKIVAVIFVMMLIFSSRFLLSNNDWYAGDSYEFKSLYTINQIIKTGHINFNIDLNDTPYKFYTGMINDDLNNPGHSAFLAIITILSKIPLELLRRFSLTTVLLVFPLMAVYQTMTKSSKFSLIYVIMTLFYFESALLISSNTANVTLAWYLSLCAVLLITSKGYMVKSYILAAFMQVVLFLTYKTSAILLLPVLIFLAYGNALFNVMTNHKISQFKIYVKSHISEVIFTTFIILSFFYYYTFIFTLIPRMFVEKLCGPILDTQLLQVSKVLCALVLVMNFIILIMLYFIRDYLKQVIYVYKEIRFTQKLKLIVMMLYTLSLTILVLMYVKNLKDSDLMITTSTPGLMMFRIVILYVFYVILGVSMIFYRKLLTKNLNNLIFLWFLGSIILFPVWYVWGGIYGLVLRSVVVFIFPAAIFVTNLFEQNLNLKKTFGKILVVVFIFILLLPTIFTSRFIVRPINTGSISKGEYYGIQWIKSNINSNKNLYSDLRIAGGIVPITEYTHIQLKGPNDSNGMHTLTDGVDFEDELKNLWYIENVSPTTLGMLEAKNISYVIHSSGYFESGIMATNFIYKRLPESTKNAFETSPHFNNVYSSKKLSVYEVNDSLSQGAIKNYQSETNFVEEQDTFNFCPFKSILDSKNN